MESIQRKDKKKKLLKDWEAKNKDRANARFSRWKSRNREKTRQYNRNWRARKKNASGNFTRDEWFALLEHYGSRCLKCGSGENLQADHVVPLSKGGTNWIDNIQPLCKRCNSGKCAKHEDYRKDFTNDTANG